MQTILIIDPDAERYYHLLASCVPDDEVIVFGTHEEAYEFLLRHHVDLVLLDHTPDTPCLELLQVLWFFAPSVPVIVVTAHGSEELAVAVLKGGACDYLKKPLTMRALKKSIHAALEGNGGGARVLSRPPLNGIQKAITYINVNYPLSLTLTDIARKAGMSVSCFERAFKKTLGIPFSHYLNKVRIARAMQMLEQNGGFSIGEIAFSCGFTDSGYFAKQFKRFTKTSPREFKKSLMADHI